MPPAECPARRTRPPTARAYRTARPYTARAQRSGSRSPNRASAAKESGADALIGELSRAAAKGRLEPALLPFLHPHVLVIDELGYLSHAPDAANVLYRVINERYLAQKPMLVTTNKPLAALGDVLHGGDLAEAILDRLLERGVHFTMRGSLVPHAALDRRGHTHSPDEDRVNPAPDATEFREELRQNLENAHRVRSAPVEDCRA